MMILIFILKCDIIIGIWSFDLIFIGGEYVKMAGQKVSRFGLDAELSVYNVVYRRDGSALLGKKFLDLILAFSEEEKGRLEKEGKIETEEYRIFTERIEHIKMIYEDRAKGQCAYIPQAVNPYLRQYLLKWAPDELLGRFYLALFDTQTMVRGKVLCELASRHEDDLEEFLKPENWTPSIREVNETLKKRSSATTLRDELMAILTGSKHRCYYGEDYHVRGIFGGEPLFRTREEERAFRGV